MEMAETALLLSFIAPQQANALLTNFLLYQITSRWGGGFYENYFSRLPALRR
jgi:hypothetical protein